MESIEEMKACGEYFPVGKIIPKRILGRKKKHGHGVTFGSNSWAIRTKTGYLVICDLNSGSCAVRVKGIPRAVFRGSPYHLNGSGTDWVGNSGRDDSAWLESALRILERKGGMP